MGFWIFMFIMDLLIPAVMIIFGRYFMKEAPKKINAVFGYRTARSMKNQETWEFAHKLFGKIWFIIGIIMVPLTVIAMFTVMGETVKQIGIMGGIVCEVQVIFLILPIFPVEKALKKNFDKDGKRR